jgi:hypothetical protein
LTDWTQDPDVVAARNEFEALKAEFLFISGSNDGLLPPNPTSAQQAAFDRMKLADSEYEVARDGAFAKPIDLSTERPLSEAEEHVISIALGEDDVPGEPGLRL